MHSWMSRMTLLLAVGLTVNGCEAGPELRPIGPELGACKEVFAKRVSTALAGLDPSWSGARTQREIIARLPSAEAKIFVSAQRSAGLERNGQSEETRALTLEKVAEGFLSANLCRTDDAKNDMYVFADELHPYLTSRGIDTGVVFNEGGAAGDDYMLHRVLLSLASRAHLEQEAR